MLGRINNDSVKLADYHGINLLGGYIRNTDKRVVIGNRLFLEMGMRHRYVMRSRIVWWLHTGEFLRGGDFDIHHKNGDRIDDRLENLEKISHVDHSKEHNPAGLNLVECTCKSCAGTFKIPKYRLKEAGRGSYCSQECYKKRRKGKSNACLDNRI